MTQNSNGSTNGKTIFLYTGNVMMDIARGSFMDASTDEANAELVNSLRHIKPIDSEMQWEWKNGSTMKYQNPETMDMLPDGEAGREEFDITVKLFYLPDAKDDIESRRGYAEEALEGVGNALGVNKFDALILSLPGIILEQDEDDYNSKDFPISEDTIAEWVKTWKILESIQLCGRVKTLGISEFGVIRLQTFLPNVRVRPILDQINLRDCCDVPRDLLEFSKRNRITLMPHMDQDNPLPKETLQHILDELGLEVRVIDMRWIVKYIVVVKERGVVENKGYVVSARIA